MPGAVAVDEDLVRRLPLPLAQLYRRAHNAKTALERHHAAFYLWEAALKLLSSVAIVEYAELGDQDPELAERLQNLARPSLGHWWEFVRRLLPLLGDRGAPVRELLLGTTRDDLPHAAGLDAVLVQVLEGREAVRARATVRLSELFDRLVRYRNREIGHGATGQKPTAFYERVGRALLAGVPEVLARLDCLAGRRLLYVADVRRQASGRWLVERYELRGEVPRRLESLDLPDGEAVRRLVPERLYLESAPLGPSSPACGEGSLGPAGKARSEGQITSDQGPRVISLHPLLVYEADEGEALFLNARRGRQRIEYLSYSTGRVLERADLAHEQCELLARVLHMPVDPPKGTEWAARSQAEERAEGLPEEVPAAPRRLGDFELLSELGRGGMGVVYRAWQPSLGRQVALKCLFQTGDPRAEARFAREIRALGHVEHPHLVKIFTSGADGDQWFYAMELVEGALLSSVCENLQTRGPSAAGVDLNTWQEAVATVCEESHRAEKPLSDSGLDGAPTVRAPVEGSTAPSRAPTPVGRSYSRHVAGLIRQVAEAAHALHEAGVVHRDIKPGNILVTAGSAEAVLMDLGLAQLADEVEGRLTRTRQFVGTLRYASPEQVLAVRKLDRRSDVYSLGATLWELLTLRPLYGAGEQTPTPDLMEKIQREEPERLRKYHPGVPADLEAIVHKCLEKDPKRRYATAHDLAEDLNRFLDGELVHARPVGGWERGWRWVRRRPTLAALLGVSGLAVLALVCLVVGLFYNGRLTDLTTRLQGALHEAQDQRARAEEHKAEADKQRDEAKTQRDEADIQRTNAEEQHRIAREQRTLAERYRYVADMNLAERAWQDKQFPRFLELLGHYQAPKPGETDFRGFEWHYLKRLSRSALLSLEGHTDIVRRVAFSPDGLRLASAGEDGTVRLWDAITGEPGRTLRANASKGLMCVAFSPDGSRLASGGSDHTVKIWDPATGEQVRTLEGHEYEVECLAFSPDGRRLASGSADNTVKIWDPATGEEVRTLEAHKDSVFSVAFSSDGRRLASGGLDGAVVIWDPVTGEKVRTLDGSQDRVYCVAYRPDGKQLAAAGQNGTIKIYEPDSGREIRTLYKSGAVGCVAYGPDGSRMVASGQDQTLTLWDANTGQELLTSKPHTDWVYSVAFSPDGTRLASGSKDHSVRVWDVTARPEALSIKASQKRVWSVAFAPDGRQLAWGGEDSSVLLWDLVPGHEPFALKGHTATVFGVAYSPDGTRLATGGADGICKLWDVKTRKEIYAIKTPSGQSVRSLAFSRDGRRLASAEGAKDLSAPGEISIWDADAGRLLFRFPEPDDAVFAVAFSPDGRWLASTSHFAVKIWDSATGQVVHILKSHTQGVVRLAFSPDGDRLASVSQDGTGKVWDAKDGREVFTLTGHNNQVLSVAYSPDGKRLATASMDRTVKVWDSTNGQEVLSLQDPLAAFYSVAFGPDSRQLAAGGHNGTVTVWDDGEEEQTPTLRHQILEKGWLDWHIQEAEAAGTNKQWFAAAFHLGYEIASQPDNGELYRLRALAYRELEDWTKTAENCTKAVQLGAADEKVWLMRGEAYASLNQPEKALADYSNALDLDSKLWDVWLYRGYVYADLRQWEKAVSDYTRALALNPNHWKIRYNRGTAYAELGRWDKAEADFAKSIALGENSVSVLKAVGEVQLGAGDVEGYRATCAAMLETFGHTDNADTANSVAWTCAVAPEAVTDLSGPIRLAEQAVASDGKRNEYLNTLGAILYRAARFEQAVQRLGEAVEVKNKEGTISDWLFLAMAHHRLGHADEAKKWLDKAEAWFDNSSERNPANKDAYKDLSWSQRLELQLHRHEAESLIKQAGGK